LAFCDVCSNKMGFLLKMKASDGFLCPNCAKICDAHTSTNVQTIKNYWEENNSRYLKFQKTNELKSILSTTITIDDTNRLFFIGSDKKANVEPVIYSFKEVDEYHFEEVGGKIVTKKKGGIGRAVVGGALFGGVGAVVGASTAKEETKKVGGVNLLKVIFSMHTGRKTIALSNPPIGFTAFLDKCIDNTPEYEISTTISTTSSADEILKYKNLLDSGVITQAEFEAKKKQLLGL